MQVRTLLLLATLSLPTFLTAQGRPASSTTAAEAASNATVVLFMNHLEDRGLVDHAFINKLSLNFAPLHRTSTVDDCSVTGCRSGLVCCDCLVPAICLTPQQCQVACRE